MNIKHKMAAMGLSVALLLAGGTLVAPYEGKENAAYRDFTGIWTQCYGNTKNVDRTKPKTDDQCTEELATELVAHNVAMKKYVKVPLTVGQEAAFTSFVYNVGEGSWRTSTLLKKLNAGQYEAACTQLLRWNKAGGVVLRGLQSRRQSEMEVCLGNNKQAIAEAERIFKQYKYSEYLDPIVGEKP